MMVNHGLHMRGFFKITDLTSGEVVLEKSNAINYEAISVAVAQSLSNRGVGTIYQMAFGNGGSSVDTTGVITYLPPNVQGTSAALYNQTFAKIVDDRSVFNSTPSTNKMTVSHVTNTLYSDILIQSLLDYGEPAGQDAQDNGSNTEGNYVFDEMGLLVYNGLNVDGTIATPRLITHVVFHPVQKALNRQYQVDYTIRCQSLTNLMTI